MKYITKLWLYSWLPVIGAFICALLILKQMKADKDYIKQLQKNNTDLEIKIQQLKNNCEK